MTTPNKERLRMWVAELRSGKYRQGPGALERLTLDETGAEVSQLCCLGVACRVAMEHEVPITAERYHGGTETSFYETRDDGSYRASNTSVLPSVVRDWLGLDVLNPVVTHNGRIASLAEFNDEGFTFAQIADMIEQEYQLTKPEETNNNTEQGKSA